MTTNFITLIFICMLPLTASSNDSFTNVTTGEITENFTHNQLTPEMSNFTPSIIAQVNPTEVESMKTSTTLPKKMLPDIHLAATSTYSMLSQSNNSTVGMKSMTEVKFKVTTSATKVVSNQASNPTTPARVPPMLSSSTQSQEAGMTLNSLFTSNKITHSSTSLTQSANHISTTTSSTKPVSTNKLPGLYRTFKTTAPFIHITKEKKKHHPQIKAKKETNHSKAVAGLIGGALVLMMIGFLVIYIKKQKLQKQQIRTSDWAGPSPFLEGGVDNGQVTLWSSNQISLSSFLPQRSSKRLSLLPETNEVIEEMTPGTTFQSKYHGSSLGRDVDGNYVKESNGIAALEPEMKSTGDAAETVN
ncbi:hypothetical protein PAMP_019130 [Pampus punctatissimus]